MGVNGRMFDKESLEDQKKVIQQNGAFSLTLQDKPGGGPFNYIQFWRKQDVRYAVKLAKKVVDPNRCVFPEDGDGDPIHPKGAIKFYPNDNSNQYEFKWGKKGRRQETCDEMTHRVFRVIKAAKEAKRDIIMTSHCDLVYLFGAYPAFLKEEGKTETTTYHDPARPHPDKRTFPWLGVDQLFGKTYFDRDNKKGAVCVATKAGTFTLTFKDSPKSNDYPEPHDVVHHWVPGKQPDEVRCIRYGDVYENDGKYIKLEEALE